jgi:hypothetical protein
MILWNADLRGGANHSYRCGMHTRQEAMLAYPIRTKLASDLPHIN